MTIPTDYIKTEGNLLKVCLYELNDLCRYLRELEAPEILAILTENRHIYPDTIIQAIDNVNGGIWGFDVDYLPF